MARKDVGRFSSLAIRSNVPDKNNNNRPQSTLVERDPLMAIRFMPKLKFIEITQRSIRVKREDNLQSLHYHTLSHLC